MGGLVGPGVFCCRSQQRTKERSVAAIDVASVLKEDVPLFRDFPPEALATLVKGSRVTTFESGEAIIEFGDEGRFLGVLLAGEAEVSVADDDGRRRRLATLAPGELFGEMSLMTGDRTMADVIGVTPCTALVVPRALFASAIVSQPSAIKVLSKTITERARQSPAAEEDRELAASAFRRSEDPYGLKLRSDVPMKLLVVNCGSSSLKYNLFDTGDPKSDCRGVVECIGSGPAMKHTYRSARGEVATELAQGSHRDAFRAMLAALVDKNTGVVTSAADVSAVGHRVVHGGERFSNAVLITDEVLAEIDKLSTLAPLHNPVNLVGIREAQSCFPNAPQVAVFDTAFHHTLPPYAFLYGLPYEYYEKKRIRRYGFHGMSHLYVSLKTAEFLKRPFNELELVSCHLGNGASVCAVDHGRSVDTSMGLTPVEGLIMGTRSGDVDAGALVHLLRTEKLSADDLDALINKKSGLKGMSGVSSDMREVEKAAETGQHQALLALKAFCYRIRKYIGAYAAAMGGLDVVVFTGGIGQGSAGVRWLACQGLAMMGIQIDEEKNRGADGFHQVCDIATPDSAVRVLVVPTDEERMIARETLGAMEREYIGRIIDAQKNVPIPVEISAHHVHLTQEHVEALFGAGHQLTPQAELSQPGQYACVEQVNLVGPKGRVDRVRVLGPVRKESQVEIAMTEQFKLGVHPPIRESGDLANTPGITLEGASGTVVLERGVICALRHVHMSPEDALRFGLRDKYMVRVRIEGARELIFGDVLIRVSPSFRLAMHIDTDEGNAAGVKTGMNGFIDAIQSRGKR
jgi:acetate kinase